MNIFGNFIEIFYVVIIVAEIFVVVDISVIAIVIFVVVVEIFIGITTSY